MVRLVKEIGFDSYDGFRALFQNAMRQRAEAYQDRARWLQALARSADGALVSRCAAAHLGNLEQAYAETVPEELTAAAATLAQAERSFVLALRGAYALGHYIHYVGRMAMPNLVLSAGRTAHDFDELAMIGPRDALLALAFRPYARETVQIARFAVERGATLVAVTDSRVSPLALGARHVLVAPTASPHFFPSLMPAMALMETLVAAIISAGDRQVIDQVAAYDRLHEALDVYWSES
jgi:DNA-binding MurR/RpiR family transcriptional regulator